PGRRPIDSERLVDSVLGSMSSSDPPELSTASKRRSSGVGRAATMLLGSVLSCTTEPSLTLIACSSCDPITNSSGPRCSATSRGDCATDIGLPSPSPVAITGMTTAGALHVTYTRWLSWVLRTLVGLQGSVTVRTSRQAATSITDTEFDW